MRPEAREFFRRINQQIAFEDACEATRKSREDPDASYWACVEWRGHGKYRRPREWRGYMNGLWCMTVRHARRGLFHAFIVEKGQIVPCAPCKTGVEAQTLAMESLLAKEATHVSAHPSLPHKPRRHPKTEEANQAARAKAAELESFKRAFNKQHKLG